MNSSSDDEENKDLGKIKVGLGVRKEIMESGSMLFFEEEDERMAEMKKVEEKKPELKQLKFKRSLKKRN